MKKILLTTGFALALSIAPLLLLRGLCPIKDSQRNPTTNSQSIEANKKKEQCGNKKYFNKNQFLCFDAISTLIETHATAEADLQSKKPERDYWEGFFCEIKFGEYLLSIFTFWLVFFTYRLWSSTEKLWNAGEKQIAIAEKSAEAARISASVAEKAFTGLERPWIFLQGAKIRRRPMDPSPPIPNNWFIQLKWKNVGRTPALIENCIFRIVPKSALPDNPDYTGSTGLTCQHVVPDGVEFDTQEVGPAPGKDEILVIFGRLVYTELNGVKHETGFALEVSPHIAAFSPYANDKYTYYT